MKKISLLFALIPAFCFAQTSTITGNIIDNMNYTDNVPDATSEVQLFDVDKKYSLSIMDRDSIKTTTADLQGNYIFKNVPPGEYIIYIRSKGALVSPMFLYNDLSIGSISDKLKLISGFDFSIHELPLQSEIKKLFDESVELSNKKKNNKYQKVEKELDKKIKEYLDSLPDQIKSFFEFFDGGLFAREFKEITIKPGIDENYTTVFKVYF